MPLMPALIIRLTAFPPPPPTPITLIFAVSCSSSSEIFSLLASGDSSNVIIYRLPILYNINSSRTRPAANPPRGPVRSAGDGARARGPGGPTKAGPRRRPIQDHLPCHLILQDLSGGLFVPVDRTPARPS